MAAPLPMAASSNNHKHHHRHQQQRPQKPPIQQRQQEANSRSNSERRKRRETAAPHVVSSDGPWCCTTAAAAASSSPPRTRSDCSVDHVQELTPSSLPALMDTSPVNAPAAAFSSTYGPYPSSYTKFNSALNAGLLNPMSPPPLDKSRSSPTLFDMMANEQDYQPRSPGDAVPNLLGRAPAAATAASLPASAQERFLLLQERVAEIISSCSPGNQLNDPDSADVRLTLTSVDGLTISLNVHRQVLVAHSRFFATKLSDRWSKQQRYLPHIVEISDCDDIEIYVETLRLMYCRDLRRRLMRENVSKVLGILKVALFFLPVSSIASTCSWI